ncbi:hypothetical protein ILYODFUR_029669 [Ilyodon furcidens]|uniref:Uncharacterized protein n=1 Tax=Ilyodon furcidens TaxID=33524 RepID=A0ABV0T1Q3_9TELE
MLGPGQKEMSAVMNFVHKCYISGPQGVTSPQVYSVLLSGNILCECVYVCFVFDRAMLDLPLCNQMMTEIIRSECPLFVFTFTLTFSVVNLMFRAEHCLAFDHD